MREPSKDELNELFGLTAIVRDLMAKLASSESIALSVYYTLFVGELVEVAGIEDNFEGVMQMLRRDVDRWNTMLKAKNAEELYELAKFTADYVQGEHHTKQ